MYLEGLGEVIQNMKKRNDPKLDEVKELYLEAFKNRQLGLER